MNKLINTILGPCTCGKKSCLFNTILSQVGIIFKKHNIKYEVNKYHSDSGVSNYITQRDISLCYEFLTILEKCLKNVFINIELLIINLLYNKTQEFWKVICYALTYNTVYALLLYKELNIDERLLDKWNKLIIKD